ncbi:50S ribosomal protein L18 [Marinicella sp. W31]|uniref:50S ribosomal protein L18 n=1 Tax=Marinicella sp. W31 TaxID=3023713 RepID=UPI00375676C0
MNTKNLKRLKRAKKTRIKLRTLGLPSLSVHKTGQHIYAQIISGNGDKTLAAASTLDKGLKVSGANIESAQAVGAAIAKKAIDAGIEEVGFDRSGYLYHGKIKALADAAREAGLKF